MNETSNNSMQFSWWSIIGIIIFTILCSALRILAIGWILLLFFWIIIPYYIIHFLGQFITIFRKNVTQKEKYIVWISTAALLIVTLTQFDCDDSRNYYVVDVVSAILFKNNLLFKREISTPLTGICILVAITDGIINIYLLGRAYRMRKARTAGIIGTGQSDSH